jgi:argininosuccinate lyase
MKGLPLTYNRDLQEDKEGFFDSYDTLIATLEVFEGMLTGMSVNIDLARRSAEGGMVLATDIADYLVSKGLPFREAHAIVSRISDYALKQRRLFSELTLSEYLDFCELFEEDVFDITVESSVGSKDVLGGTAPGQVLSALKEARSRLEAHRGA